MKMIIVLAALVAVALAGPLPQHNQEQVVVVKETFHDNIGLPQGYAYDFQLSDGQSRQEQAQFKDVIDEDGKPAQALTLVGSYSFVGPDGQEYVVQYTADENGFHPSGAHLPA